ncbi:MAG: hypothetical protein AMJ56_19050 [Anaerolineae bacterium SG8_19]|jgi:hypothetical protein|nr:MAG: hypothetical protein AMJ56_19050 [Anaerolineae bacterium SG8_19]
MSLKLPVNRMMEKMVGLVEWVTNGRWQIVQSDRVDELYTEIYQLEKTLAKAPTRPMRVQKPKSLEPITEQQKIMDLAG